MRFGNAFASWTLDRLVAYLRDEKSVGRTRVAKVLPNEDDSGDGAGRRRCAPFRFVTLRARASGSAGPNDALHQKPGRVCDFWRGLLSRSPGSCRRTDV